MVGEASAEAERRNEGGTKCVRNPEKRELACKLGTRNPMHFSLFCEAKSHPKNTNLKLDICPSSLEKKK